MTQDTVPKEIYDEVCKALKEENEKITELAAATRELNVKLGLQIRELRSKLLKSKQALRDQTPPPND